MDGGREEKLGQRAQTKLQTELELKPGSAEREGCGIKGSKICPSTASSLLFLLLLVVVSSWTFRQCLTPISLEDAPERVRSSDVSGEVLWCITAKVRRGSCKAGKMRDNMR